MIDSCAGARSINTTLPPVESWVGVGAAGGVLAAVGLSLLLLDNPDEVESLLRTTPALVALVEIAGFALAVLAVVVRRSGWAVIPLLAVAVADGVRAHPNVAQPGSGALLTTGHLIAVAIWVGALAYVVRAGVRWRYRPPAVRWMVTAYARIAAWLFAAVVASGAVAALLLVPLPAVVTTGYGQLLVAKLALVATAPASPSLPGYGYAEPTAAARQASPYSRAVRPVHWCWFSPSPLF